MKPTVKIIVTSPDPELPTRFVKALSDTEVTPHERKVPNPLSATKEEAVLDVHTGRAEWEDMAVQAVAVPAQKRHDFVWATLLKDMHGALILVDGHDGEQTENVRRLVKLFSRLELSACVVAVPTSNGSDGHPELRQALQGPYAVESCNLEDGSSVDAVVRKLVSLVPA